MVIKKTTKSKSNNNNNNEIIAFAEKKQLIHSNNNSFQNDYHLEDEINSGAFGTVYQTYKKSNPNTKLAVKVVHQSGSFHEDKLIIKEVCIMRDLLLLGAVVPYCIRLIDFRITSSSMYIVQELATGGDVYDRIEKKGYYDEQDARKLTKNLLLAIQGMHSIGIVHRDLKPENLLLKNKSDDTYILLCDFGEAKHLPKDNDEGLLSLCGTPQYAAPEMVEGKSYREECDMWSVGCILYFVLSGNMPFGSSDDYGVLYELTSEEDYDFDDEAWDFVSGSAKKVIKNLIKKSQKKRWTATEALESSWFVKEKKCPRFSENGESETFSSSSSSKHHGPKTFDDDDNIFDFSGCFIHNNGSSTLHADDETETTIDSIDYDSSSLDDHNKITATASVTTTTSTNKKKTTTTTTTTSTTYYKIKEIQNKSIIGLDYNNSEQYLSDNDFKLVFNGAPRSQVAKWGKWRIQKYKRRYKIW